ncbi:MAG: hypothetical protein HS114_14500 [Anaerolineales bacterium]|nr:hypothetical protein [Anaerolineales bacterium]
MTDSHQMFCTLMQTFLLHLPRSAWGDIRRLVTLAWAVVGLCWSQKASLSSWGEAVKSQAHKPPVTPGASSGGWTMPKFRAPSLVCAAGAKPR